MTDAQRKKLDEIADQMGVLYQAVGRLDIHPSVQSNLLDEVLAITHAIEAVSGRAEDERH